MNKKERDSVIDTDGGFIGVKTVGAEEITGAVEATGMGDGIGLA